MMENERFTQAVNRAAERERGLHGSVGTQNEKLVHAALKNYYAPFSDEQEVRVGNFIADALGEDGIYEIQTKNLYRLKKKLELFLEISRVNLVLPVIRECGNFYVDSISGEVIKGSPPRKYRSMTRIFEELYSIREFLANERLQIIIAELKCDKIIYIDGGEIPKKRRRYDKKPPFSIIPKELTGEVRLCGKRDYRQFLPENAPDEFTKKELSKLVGEAKSSLRCEVLRSVGILKTIGKVKNANLYSLNGENENDRISDGQRRV